MLYSQWFLGRSVACFYISRILPYHEDSEYAVFAVVSREVSGVFFTNSKYCLVSVHCFTVNRAWRQLI